LDISQYAHTAWRVREGFTRGTIYSIAQTPDGYLWLGTEFGLLRFDGVRTVTWQPPRDRQLPSTDISALLAARDGTLWIGTRKGLASWKGGTLTQYAELAGQAVLCLLEDREGSVWVGTLATPAGKLCAIRSGTVRCYGEDGRFGPLLTSLYEDHNGTLWAGGTTGAWRWRPGPPKLYPFDDPYGIRGMAEDDDGALLIGMRGGVTRFVDGKTEIYPLPRVRPLHNQRLLRDRHGGLWIATSDEGLVHAHQGSADVFAEADGLSGDDVESLFEDREGNVWAGTSEGLDRFRDLAVPTLTVRQGLPNAQVWSVLADQDGSVWLGAAGGLSRWNHGQVTAPRTGSDKRDGKLNGLDPHSLYRDHDGRLWVSTYGGIGYLESERYVAMVGVPGGNVQAIAQDPRGNLWLANLTAGLFRVSPQREVEGIPWATLGREDSASALAADPSPNGGLWLGFRDGGIAYFADGQVRVRYGTAEGLGAGRVNGLRLDPEGALWAATEGGLSRLKNGGIATLSSANGLPCDAVHWAIEDDTRSLWLYMACGLVRVVRPELGAWVAAADKDKDTKRTIQTPTVLDSSDGVRNRAGSGGYVPHVSRSTDGKLWFTAFPGVSVLDPAHLPVNKLPPPVHIEQIIADRKTYDLFATSGPLRLPPLVRDLQIDFTALSLVVPEKVRFRYKLEGRDRDWQDAGNRRRAFYSDLPPRDYRFRVTACNNSGVWNEAGVSLDFSVAPAYYQTTWFRLLCAVAFLALLAALYQLRLRQVTQQLRLRMEGRLEERERIARDLHDTLLQSVQGLILKVDAAAKQIPSGEAARLAIEKTLDHADQVLAEGRDRVRNLRATIASHEDLPAAFQHVARESPQSHAVSLKTVVEGRARELHPLVLEESYSIGREALINALTHSGAPNVEVEITYDPKQFRLRVRDDGRGVESSVLEEGGRSGHWGLPGMRERARKMGAAFELWSRPGSGTEVELKVPGSVAYRRFRDRPRRRWFRRSSPMD
jgi:ligand-binding sensor domain-containing protein/signal transduction histidine kinase